MVISFVIPTLNEAAYLSRCVRSIRRLKRPSSVTDIDITIVDTGSSDQTLTIAAAVADRVLQMPGATVAAARNSGCRDARGELLAFVDADCELPEDWLSYGLAHLQRPDILAAGTSLMAPPATATWVERHWHRVSQTAHGTPYEFVRWLPTSNLLVWRHAFSAADGFNEALVTCEDCDFGYRLSREHKIVLEHRVRTRHLRESRTVTELFRREWWRGLGNFQSWRLHRWDRHELWSVVGPPLFLMCMLTLLLTAMLPPSPQRLLIIAFEAIAIAVTPWLMLLKRGVGPHVGFSTFVRSYVLVCVYLSARGIAVFNRRKRLEPAGVAKVECDSRT
ncbi:MAG TPA: glycosyltransferase [Vicinamibacterales bacterium]|nr:glycosyltransferase [Vicinamibacterales bacterium]